MATYFDKSYTQQEKSEINAPYKQAAIIKSQQRVRSCYVLPFYVNQHDLQILNKIFPEKEIETSSSNRREHPIAASINYIINEKFQNMANTVRARGCELYVLVVNMMMFVFTIMLQASRIVYLTIIDI